ncbi:hypothetical protein LTR16_010617, partial [Cryomyces antarcticus]
MFPLTYRSRVVTLKSETAEDFGDDIREAGWYFEQMQEDYHQDAGDKTPTGVSVRILTTPVSLGWPSREIALSQESRQVLKEGGRLAIWARAQ